MSDIPLNAKVQCSDGECGKRMRNGWKNSMPWTYHLDPELVWLPSEGELDILRTTLDI